MSTAPYCQEAPLNAAPAGELWFVGCWGYEEPRMRSGHLFPKRPPHTPWLQLPWGDATTSIPTRRWGQALGPALHTPQ